MTLFIIFNFIFYVMIFYITEAWQTKQFVHNVKCLAPGNVECCTCIR